MKAMRQDLQICRKVGLQREQGENREVGVGDGELGRGGEGDRLPEDSSPVAPRQPAGFQVSGDSR